MGIDSNQPKLMKKIVLLMIVTTPIVFAQVGVETSYPKGSFHVDGKKDNPKDATTAINVNQQLNDVIINSNNFGTGTINPTNRLDINNGTTNGAIKIVDGTEGDGKVLMSDADGLATWQMPNSFKKISLGIFPNPKIDVVSDGIGNYKYSQVSIELTKGRWIINSGLTLRTNMPNGDRYWLHAYLSTSKTAIQQSGFTHLGLAGVNTSYANTIFGNPTSPTNPYAHQGSNFLSGSSLIDVTNDKITLYIIFDNSNSLPEDNGNRVVHYTFGTDALENYFYAFPVE